MDVKSAGKLGRRLRRLMEALNLTEVERLLHAMPAEHVAPYRFSQLRLSLLHILAERSCSFCIACKHPAGFERLARWLLRERGCDPDATDAEGVTPLWMAVGKSNLGVVRALIAGGATINYSIPPRPKPKRYLKWAQLRRYHDAPLRICMPRHTETRIAQFMLDAGYAHGNCKQDWGEDERALCWWCDWREHRTQLLAKVMALLGVWQRRQPNATHGVDRHVMRQIVQLVWRRRFISPSSTRGPQSPTSLA